MGLPKTAARGMKIYPLMASGTLGSRLIGSSVAVAGTSAFALALRIENAGTDGIIHTCLLYTSDAADE